MYYNISIDIAKFEGDAIVNSLGAGTQISVPGRIYSSILRGSKDSDALKKEVAKIGGNKPFGSLFVTDSYGLPCKKIIHVITPIAEYDPDLSQIKKCYEDILELALKEGVKSILVPPIGTGANGYESDEVATIARRVCYLFAEEHPEIDVYFNIYTVEFPDGDLDEREERIMRERFSNSAPGIFKRNYTNDSTARKSKRPSDKTYVAEHSDTIIKPATLTAPNKAQSFLDLIGVEYGDTFATLVKKCVYARAKKDKKKTLSDVWLEINSLIFCYKKDNGVMSDTVDGIAQRDPYSSEVTPINYGEPNHLPQDEWEVHKKDGKYLYERPNKAEILLACIGLRLNKKEALEVYEFCGYSLSPYERYDYALRKCLDYLSHKHNAWTRIVKEYRFYASESIYAYPGKRVRIYMDSSK